MEKPHNNRIKIAGILILALVLGGWGNQGHWKISYKSYLSFPVSTNLPAWWADSLASHASDADIRKAWDPDESPRHYIDIDNYPDFISQGEIHTSYDTNVSRYGYSFVLDQGILPWATLNTYDSLVLAFMQGNETKAIRFASDLGHYVADGHMPLHLTANYDGQLTGQDGIHSRFESTMINANINSINYAGSTVDYVQDKSAFVFEYIYQNYPFVDSVLIADSIARANAGGSVSNSVYKSSLWNLSKGFTTELFRLASLRIAALIYSARVDAGCLRSSSHLHWAGNKPCIHKVFPNPANDICNIEISLGPDDRLLFISLKSIDGRNFHLPYHATTNGGIETLVVDVESVGAGYYTIVIHTLKARVAVPLIIAKM